LGRPVETHIIKKGEEKKKYSTLNFKVKKEEGLQFRTPCEGRGKKKSGNDLPGENRRRIYQRENPK